MFASFMRRITDSEVHAITVSLAGTFVPTDDLLADAARAAELNAQIVERPRPQEDSGRTSMSMTCR
jgi:hypothetical protein